MFTGWSLTGDDDAVATSLDNVKENIVATAEYEINTYSVVFKDYDGTVLDTQTVDWNTAQRLSIRHARGYTFTWLELTRDDDAVRQALIM